MKWWSLLFVPLVVFTLTERSQAQVAFRAPASKARTTTVKEAVLKMRDDDEGVVVLFVKAKGNHYLRREMPNFDKLREALQNSMNEKKPVSVIVESETLNIVDVK